MDTVRLGRSVRALRMRRRWRQVDLAAAARLSRGTIARTELGQADRVTLAALERVANALGARLRCSLDYNGEALDRLLDAAHAAIVEAVIRFLATGGWACDTEVSFSVAGERGSIDVLAWNEASGCLLVVEVKSVVPDLQVTLVTLDRKARLAAGIAAKRGWRAASTSRLLVIGESRTSRRRVEAHGAVFGAALPDRARAVRSWLRRPDRDAPLRGIWFLSPAHHRDTRHRVRPRRNAGPHAASGQT